VNEEQTVQALQALGANWPHLRDLDPIGIELWHRNALRDTPFDATPDKPGALEVIDRLVATMTFAPKPHDWLEAYRALRAERRRSLALDTRSITAPPADMAAAAEAVRRIRARYFPEGET